MIVEAAFDVHREGFWGMPIGEVEAQLLRIRHWIAANGDVLRYANAVAHDVRIARFSDRALTAQVKAVTKATLLAKVVA